MFAIGSLPVVVGEVAAIECRHTGVSYGVCALWCCSDGTCPLVVGLLPGLFSTRWPLTLILLRLVVET